MVFPLFVERDFLYPVLFQKFHAAYFAGLSWQRATACDMLGDPASPASYDGAVLRDVLRILLFPTLFALPSTAPHASREVAPAAPISNVIAGSGGSLSPRPSTSSLSTSASANNLHAASGSSSLPSASSGTLAASSATAISASLSQSLKRSASLLLQCVLLQRWELLYQQTLLSSDSIHVSNSMHAQGNTSSSTNNVSREEMYEAEVALWRLIHLPAATTANHDAAWEINDEEEAGVDDVEEEEDVGFHRSQAALTLKCYRRMLAVAAWRPHAPPASFAASSSFSSTAGKKDTSLMGSRIGGGLPSGGDIRGSSPTATSSTSLSFFDFLLGRSSAATASPAPAPSSETIVPSTAAKLAQSEEEEEVEEKRAHHSSSRYHPMVVTSGSKDEPVLTLLDQQQQSHLHHRHANLQDLEEELDEIFALMHLLAIVSKVLLQTDHASSKQQQHNNQPLPATNHANLNPHQRHHLNRNMRLRQQFQSLSVSTRSDVANMLLEALHLCTRRCQTRIDTDRWLPALRHTCVAALPALRAKGGIDRDRAPSQEDTKTRRHRSMVKQGWGTAANRRHRAFLLTPRPVSSSSTAPVMENAVGGDAMHELRYQAQLPALAVFQLLCEGLVLPATVQDFLWRIFQTTTTTY